MEDKILMTRIEAGKYLGLAHHTLDVWASSGKSDLKYIKIGRSVKYRKSDLDEFIASRVTTGTRVKSVPAEPSPKKNVEEDVNNNADRESLMLVSSSLVKLTDVIKRHAKLPIYTQGIPSAANKPVLDIMRDCFFELESTMKGDYDEALEYRNFVDRGIRQLTVSELL